MSGAIGSGSLLDLVEPAWRRELAAGVSPAGLGVEPGLLRATAAALGEQARLLTADAVAARWPGCVVVALARVAATEGNCWPAWQRMTKARATRQSADQWGGAFQKALAVLGLAPPGPPDATPRDAVHAYLAAAPAVPAGPASPGARAAGARAAGAGDSEVHSGAADPGKPMPGVRLDPFGHGVLLATDGRPRDGEGHRPALPDEVTDPGDPLLVFDADGERAGPVLPADVVWALYPADTPLRSDVPPRLILAVRPPLAWRSWRLDQLDLHGVSWIGLNERTSRTVRGRTSPVLRTSLPVPGVTAERRPVYAAPPDVLLPPGSGRWRVEVRRVVSGAALASVTAGGESWRPDVLWRKAPRPLLGELTITATALDRGTQAARTGLRRTVVVAEGLVVTSHPAPRLPCEHGLEPADAVITAPPGMTVSPSALPFPPEAAARDITCVAGPVVQRLTVTPPHISLRVDPEPGSAQAPSPWHHAGPLRLAPRDLWRGGALRLGLPGVAAPPPVVITARAVARPAGEPAQVLAPTRQGRYPLRRLLDTMTANGDLDLAITLDGRTAVIATVTTAKQAADPWAIG